MPKKRTAKDKSKKNSDKKKHHKKEDPRDKGSKQVRAATACAEHGVWTGVTQVRPRPVNQQPLEFRKVDPMENHRILSSGKMSFAVVGCSGDPVNGVHTQRVAAAISADKELSFFYHLGDMIYTVSGSDAEGGQPAKPYSHSLWDQQLFGPFEKFPGPIFAIAGNHDGKYKTKMQALRDYFRFFCADRVEPPNGSKRRKMMQPYVYWTLDTPYAYIIGLYSNIANAGILDDPRQYTTANFKEGPQYKWFVRQLRATRKRTAGSRRKAVLLAVHYPPYSGAANFNVRGDPSEGGPAAKGTRPAQPNNYNAPYLATALQEAFKASKQRPDAIFSAHAHLYQRLNYKFADGTTMPCLVVGCGGHSPLEKLFEKCNGIPKKKPAKRRFPAVKPGTFEFPRGDSAKVKFFDDKKRMGRFGYLKVTLDAKAQTLTCQFMAVKKRKAVEMDSKTISIG